MLGHLCHWRRLEKIMYLLNYLDINNFYREIHSWAWTQVLYEERGWNSTTIAIIDPQHLFALLTILVAVQLRTFHLIQIGRPVCIETRCSTSCKGAWLSKDHSAKSRCSIFRNNCQNVVRHGNKDVSGLFDERKWKPIGDIELAMNCSLDLWFNLDRA